MTRPKKLHHNITMAIIISDLFKFIIKPKIWRTNINVSLLIEISSIVWPIKRMSLIYISKCILIIRKRAIGTFKRFAKILEAGLRPKHRQRNSYRLPDHRKLRNFLDDSSSRIQKYASLKSVSQRKSFSWRSWNLSRRENLFLEGGISSYVYLSF